MADDNLPDAVREYQQKFGEGTLGRALAFVPGDCGEQRTSIARYADAAIDALIEERKMLRNCENCGNEGPCPMCLGVSEWTPYWKGGK